MNSSISSSLLALRDADPAHDANVATLVPDWQSILAEIIESDRVLGDASTAAPVRATDSATDSDVDTATGPAPVRRPLRRPQRPQGAVRPQRPRARRIRLALAGALIAVAALVAGVIAWPGSGHGPTSIAYGVTKLANGTVAVRQSAGHEFTADSLQAQLRAVGVPARVLTQSAPGACLEPVPATVPTLGPVIVNQGTFAPSDGFILNPAAIPAGAVVVIVLFPLGPNGARAADETAVANLFVTADPPTCVGRPSGAAPLNSSSVPTQTSPSR